MAFVIDINGDGQVTLDELQTWLWDSLFLPGEFLLSLLVTHAPGIASFLSLGPENVRDPLVLVVSVFVWLCLLLLVAIAITKFNELDRALTVRVMAWLEELKRMIRVLRRRLTSRIGYWRQRRATSAEIIVDELQLTGSDANILRCHGCTGDDEVLRPDQVEARLGLAQHQVRAALARLRELRLIEPSVDRLSGQGGHIITQTGQIYLLD